MNRHHSDNLVKKSSLQASLDMLDDERKDQLEKFRRYVNSSDYDPTSISDADKLKWLEKELRNIEDSMKELERKLFYMTLMDIDYNEQFRFFRDFHSDHATGAFLLHGSLDKPYEGRLIVDIQLERLIPNAFESKDTHFFKHDCHKIDQVRDIESLRNQLIVQTSPAGNAEPQAIINLVSKLLETKNIVFIIENIEERRPEEVVLILEKFWKPLELEVLNATSRRKPGYHYRKLFLFLVDYTGNMINKNIPCREADFEYIKQQGVDDNSFGIPIRLSSVTHFSYEHLREWINHASNSMYDSLEERLVKGSIDSVIQKIMNGRNNEDPYRVMERICELCDYPFEEGVRACLTL